MVMSGSKTSHFTDNVVDPLNSDLEQKGVTMAYTQVLTVVLYRCRPDYAGKAVLESKKKIGGYHAFFRDNYYKQLTII